MTVLLIALALLALAPGISHSLTLSWARNGEAITNVVTVTANGETNLDLTVPANTTDLRADIDLDADKIQSLYILSDQNVTIETNSGTSPGNTLTIGANKPYVWYLGCGLTNPITTDVAASIYVTNPSTTLAANVQIRVLQDMTS
ncbi:unnamed protein product [Gemmata massiliana]|uniref:Uncharacterized protein n=1 Tax=Gemmata massiliana TaxID=1210884 RepID=A0A6P2DCI9_9BACT|nr:hypothetical protein [Gemmata massiliana]VTR99240.1 unnamed protein product [Gemmata massiliana]